MKKRLKIIGSSHIAKESIKLVDYEINNYLPHIVALELDKKRVYSLIAKKEQKPNYFTLIRRIGIKGLIFSLIGAYAQKKLGNIVGVEPGSEMKHALEVAKSKKLEIALIDQDIEITLRKFSKAVTYREKWNFIVDIFKAIITKKQQIKFDIQTVPSDEIIEKLIYEVKSRYPNVYDVLIEQRNKIMAKKIFLLLKNNQEKKILAVVGAGHKKEILKLIKKYEKEN